LGLQVACEADEQTGDHVTAWVAVNVAEKRCYVLQFRGHRIGNSRNAANGMSSVATDSAVCAASFFFFTVHL